MEKNLGESTLTKGVFFEQTFAHILEEGEPDYDDYTEIDLEHLPELGYTDEEVELEVRKMTPAEHAHFGELRRHYELQYRMQGNIKPLREVVQEVLEERYPVLPGSQSDRVCLERERLHDLYVQSEEVENENLTGATQQGERSTPILKQEYKTEINFSHLSLYLAKTISETIDLTMDADQNLYIKVELNQTFHNVLTHEGEDMDGMFNKDASDEVEAISIYSSECEDPFTGEVAAKLLRKLAKNKREASELQEEVANLLEEETLPLEEAKEVFKSGVMGNTKSTAVSEWLFNDCASISDFHLILALGYRVREEARAYQAVQSDRVGKPLPFKEIVQIFEVKQNTIINNLNQAVEWHNRRATRSDSKRRQEEESSSQDFPHCGPKIARTGLTTEDYFEVKAEPVSPTPEEES